MNIRYFHNSPHKTPETGIRGVLETPTSSLTQRFTPLSFLKNLQLTFSHTIFSTLIQKWVRNFVVHHLKHKTQTHPNTYIYFNCSVIVYALLINKFQD